MDFMLQIAAQVAVAVDNSLNFEKAEKYQRQLARERDRLQVLLEITNALVSELDIHDLFPSITACLRRAKLWKHGERWFWTPRDCETPAHAVQRLVDAGLKSVCCVPLISRAHALGTLNVGSTRPSAFSASDVDFLAQVAGQAAYCN